MIFCLKYQLPWTTFKDLRYFFKDKQNAVKNEVQMPCGRSKIQGKVIISKIKTLSPISFMLQLFKIVEI